MIERLRRIPFRRVPYWVPLYVVALYLAGVFASYSKHWKEWPTQVHAEQMTKIMTPMGGTVEKVRTFGWGLYKDYFIRINGYDFYLPGAVANAKLRQDNAPQTNVDSLVTPGAYIYIDVLGRQNPVVVGLSIRTPDGGRTPILVTDVGVRRFELMYRNAPSQANYYQHLAWRVIAGAILLHLLIFGFKRMRRSKAATR